MPDQYVTALTLRNQVGRRLTIEESEGNILALRLTADYAYNAVGSKANTIDVIEDINSAIAVLSGNVSADSNTLEKLANRLNGVVSILTTDNVDLNTAREWIAAIQQNENLINVLTTDRVTGTQVGQSITDAVVALKSDVSTDGNTLAKLRGLISDIHTGILSVGVADKLSTARTIRVAGAVAGSASFDGSSSIVINTVKSDIPGIVAGVYGDELHIPVIEVNTKGEVVSVNKTTAKIAAATVNITGAAIGTGVTGPNESIHVTLNKSGVTDALGFTPEDVSAKVNSFNLVNANTYPTTQAVKDLLDYTVGNINTALDNQNNSLSNNITTSIQSEVTNRNIAIQAAKTDLVGDASIAANTLGKLESKVNALQTLVSTDDTLLDTAQEWITAIKSDENLIAGLTSTKADKSQVATDIANAVKATSLMSSLSNCLIALPAL